MDDYEQAPLLSDTSGSLKRIHSTYLYYTTILDFSSGFLLFVIYTIFYTDWTGFPRIEHLIPLDLFILNVCRSWLLILFLRKVSWVVEARIPVWTTFGSLLYLLIRTKLASTIAAYLTLGMAFLCSWLELLIYVHAMLIHGQDYWSEEDEDADSIDSSAFIFPEIVTYEAQAPVTIFNSSGDLPDRNDPKLLMGTSAPISIAATRKSLDFNSKSYAFDHMSNGLVPESSNAYKSYLKRVQETMLSYKSLLKLDINEAQEILKKNSRHTIIPRFSLCLLETSMFNSFGDDLSVLFHNLNDLMNLCKNTSRQFQRLTSKDAIAAALSDTVTADFYSTTGKYCDAKNALLDDFEQLFWKYLELENECIIAQVYLYQGVFRVLSGQSLKGSIHINKANQLYKDIYSHINDLGKSYLRQTAGFGPVGEAVYSLKSSVTDSYLLGSSIIKILANLFPELNNYVKDLSRDEEAYWASIRELHQLALKGSFKSLTASLVLLYTLQHEPLGFMSTLHSSDEQEILAIISNVDNAISLPLISYMILRTYRRLGLCDSALLASEKALLSATNALKTETKIQRAILNGLNLKLGEFAEMAQDLWERMQKRHQNDKYLSLDIFVGILYVSSRKYDPGPRKSSLEISSIQYLEFTLIPRLTEKYLAGKASHSPLIKTLKWTLTLAMNSFESFNLLFFWFLYLNGDLLALVSSKKNIPRLINLSGRLFYEYNSEPKDDTGTVIYSLLQGTILKYLALFRVEQVSHIEQSTAEASRDFYTSALNLEPLLDPNRVVLELGKKLLFEFAELECLCFFNWHAGKELLERCFPEDRIACRARAPSTSSPVPKLSFKKREHRSSSQIESQLSASFISQGDWGMDSKAGDFDWSNMDSSDENLKSKCDHALNFIKSKLIGKTSSNQFLADQF